MALSGYERVKRHRQKRGGLPVGLLSRGQKAGAAAALMAAEGISRATAFRRLETFVSNLPVKWVHPAHRLAARAKAVATRRAKAAAASRVELGEQVAEQRERDADFAEAERACISAAGEYSKTVNTEAPKPGYAAASGRINRGSAWAEQVNEWAWEFTRRWDEDQWQRANDRAAWEADQRRKARERYWKDFAWDEQENVEQVTKWERRAVGWREAGRAQGIKTAYVAGAEAFANGEPTPPKLSHPILYAAVRQGWEEARDRIERS